ncbi:MAG: hypothetical protein VKJ46_12235 [Leptolyngbyaceae bacterium]|nr:hypothetical protein [Leptolyngbyaceae bacterium]
MSGLWGLLRRSHLQIHRGDVNLGTMLNIYAESLGRSQTFRVQLWAGRGGLGVQGNCLNALPLQKFL